MKKALSLLLSIGLASCDSGGGGKSGWIGEEAMETTAKVFQVNLPEGTSDCRVDTARLMTSVYEGRFDVPADSVSTILQDSPLLADRLTDGNLFDGGQGFSHWWTPESLHNVSGLESEWMYGDSIARCSLVVGDGTDPERKSVFWRVTYESRDQAGGMELEVRADPSWEPN